MDMQVQADEGPIYEYTLKSRYAGVHLMMSKKLSEVARKLPLKPSDWSLLIRLCLSCCYLTLYLLTWRIW